jgi:hypothetical protein
LEGQLTKIKIPLPPGDASGGEAEWVWAAPQEDDTFVLRNVPTFATGLSYGDIVSVIVEDGAPIFDHVVERGGHSTYRIYAASSRQHPDIARVLDELKALNCEFENATDRIVGIDVPPNADIYSVYRVLEERRRRAY